MTVARSPDRLADCLGIEDRYRDFRGRIRRVSAETRCALAEAMGFVLGEGGGMASAAEALEEASWRSPLEPVLVAAEGEPLPPIPIVLGAGLQAAALFWEVEEEGGRRHRGRIDPAERPLAAARSVGGRAMERRGARLPVALPTGYHRFRLTGAAEAPASMALIVAPPRCHLPEALAGDGRVWGVAIQLYGLRSDRNWGIGDFTDLRRLAEVLGPLGADLIGVNPLHALFLDNPDRVSPYSPASRLFLNALYIDVEAVPDLVESAPARARVEAMRAEGRLDRLRAATLVDYAGVAAAKLPVLEDLHASFRARHLLSEEDERAAAFRAFQAERGPALGTFALFEALSEHFRQIDGGIRGWRDWPAPFRDPRSSAVAAFAEERRERIEFFQYLQWQADLQLRAAAETCKRLGMRIGLYPDLALGVDAAGAEVWAEPTLFASGASTGAPPDRFNTMGQDWGLPPIIPRALRERAYRPLIDVLRANMRHAGALRIDHILGFMRLFWIPAGAPPPAGGYVDYPLGDLLAVLALESRRSRCLVVGEDLGTVPEGLADALRRRGVLSYRLLYFERTDRGGFAPPQVYPPLALAAVTTHDLPTLPGYWLGHDIETRDRLGLFASDEARESARRRRTRDRRALIAALRREGLLPAGARAAREIPPEVLASAVYRYLARAPAKLLMLSLEDVLGELDQANLPGTTNEYPNWRRKMAVEVGALATDPRVVAMAAALRELRPSARGRAG